MLSGMSSPAARGNRKVTCDPNFAGSGPGTASAAGRINVVVPSHLKSQFSQFRI